MVFTREELMALEDPYKVLKSQDALLDNLTVIDALNYEEKNP